MLIKLKTNLTRQTRGVNIIALAGVIALPLMVVTPAFAGTHPSDDVSIMISASDLQSPQGVTEVYETFVTEAGAACAGNSGSRLIARRLEAKCIDDLVEDFVLDLAHPELTALHNGGKITVE